MDTETVEPIADATPTQEAQEEASGGDLRGAIDRAFDSLDAQQDDSQPIEADPQQDEGQQADRERGPDGKFIAKAKEAVEGEQAEGATETRKFEAPSRFSPDAKAAWGAAPEPVKAEINRAITELEQGLSQYKERFEPLKQYDDIARQHGTTMDQMLGAHVNFAKALNTDFVDGLDQICSVYGKSIYDVIAELSGQQPDQAMQQQNKVINDLRAELSSLKNELGGVTTTLQSQTQRQVMEQINQFSQDKPRFDELANDIAFFLKTGRAEKLQDAYDLAERLNPAPQSASLVTAAPAAQSTQAAQPRKGNLSLTGAPSSGSNPANRKPPNTARDAIDNAFASVGLT